MSWDILPKSSLQYVLQKLKDSVLGTAAYKNTGTGADNVILGNDSRLTDARNAADVYSWAKAATKPSYTKAEVGLGDVDNTSDLDKPISTATQAALDAKADSADVTGTKTLTGDIISVSDAAPILAENVTSAIDPIQDLHGYDYPWVGGAGKNVLPLTLAGIKALNTGGSWSGNTYTQRGVTVSIITDNSGNITEIKAVSSSAPTNELWFKLSPFTYKAGLSYKLNGCPAGGAANTYNIESDNLNIRDTGSGATITQNADYTDNIYIVITPSAGAVNLSFKPMLRLATESDATFAPYTNICPIQGHDMCEVVRTGVNIWDEEWEVGDIDNNGQPQSSSTLIRTKNFNSCQPSTTYYVKAPTGISIYVKYYDEDKNFISPTVTPVNNTITTPNNCKFFKLVVGSAYGTTYNHDISINYPSTDTQYHAYTGQTYPIQIGNKNQLQLSLDTIKSFNTDGVWSGNTYALNGVELTVVTDDDGLVTEIKVVSQGSVSNDVIFKIASMTYKADVEYILNGCPTGGSSNEYAIWSFDTGSENVDIDEGDGVEIEKSSDTAASVCIRIRYLYGASNLSFKPMLRFASITNPDFSPYNPLFAQQGMCFGGELDVTNGVLTVDRALVTYDGSEDEEWSMYGTGSAATYAMKITIADMFTTAFTDLTLIKSNYLKSVAYSDTWGNYDAFISKQSTLTNIICGIKTITTLSNWKTYLSSNNLQVCYKLATPIEIQLTPQELKLLQDTNNLTTNGTTITLGYQPNNVIGEVKGEIDELKEYVDATFLPKSKSKGIIYGMHIDGTESDPDAKITYLADAVGMTPAYMDFTKGEFNYGSWGDAFFMPRPCMLRSNGFVDYYLKPTDLTKKLDETASDVTNTSYDGNAMMEWGQLDGSRIWLKIVPDANGIGASVYIADHRADPDFHDWAFHNYKSQSSDFFYTPIYNGSVISDKMRSLSGQQVSNNLNATQERTAAQLNNPTDTPIWDIETFADITLINFLAILITKSTDGQAKFGQGLSSGGTEALNNGFRTGVHDDKGLFYGTNSGTISSTTYGNAVKIFGMENWFGFQWRRYIGHVMVNGVQKAKLTYGQEDGSTTTGYNLTGDGYKTENPTAPTGTSGSYIKSFLYTEDGPFLKDVSGSSTTYYKDGGWFNNSITAVPLRSATSHTGARCGPFAVHLSYPASCALWALGASLSCHPVS